MKGEVGPTDVVKGAIAGLVGGLVASFVMGEFQSLVTRVSKELKPSKNTDKKEKKENSEPATVKVAEAVSENLFDHHLSKSEKGPSGEAVHYAMGATSGLVYGIAAEVAPITAIGAGIPFGAAVWAIADDVVVPALGLSKPMTEYPLSKHAYALSSHLVYGLATDIVRRIVRKAL